MLIIEPLGTRVILPAFIVGYELDEASSYQISRRRNSPAWIATLLQQAGGMVMWYPSVVGTIIRFSDNLDRIRGDGGFLIRGFRAMAEDPDYQLLERDYPVLRELVGTWGHEYSKEELMRLQGFLGRYMTVPHLESGTEAFIRHVPCDVLHFLGDWQVLSIEALSTLQEKYPGPNAPSLHDGTLSHFKLQTLELLDSKKMDILVQFGAEIGQTEPRVFLLWENCD